MISDTLSDAIAEIDLYLTDPAFSGAYAEADVRAHVQRVRGEMEALRMRLDGATPASGPFSLPHWQICCLVNPCCRAPATQVRRPSGIEWLYYRDQHALEHDSEREEMRRVVERIRAMVEEVL